MNYSKLVAVTGLSGLFELISTKADGGIVRSLEDKSTRFVSNRVHQFSHLESIEVYTTKDNVNLADIFNAMDASKEKLPDSNDAKAIRAYFEKVYPDMDFDRVYGSDMKKMVKWFNILKEKGIKPEVTEESPAEAEQEKKATPAKQVEQKAATVKNAPAKKVNTPRRMA